MPVHKVNVGGKTGYQWGRHGHVYFGPGAAEKAAAQGRAAYAHGYKGSHDQVRELDLDALLGPARTRGSAIQTGLPLVWRDFYDETPPYGAHIVVKTGALHVLGTTDFELPEIEGFVHDTAGSPDFITLLADDVRKVPQASRAFNLGEGDYENRVEIHGPFRWRRVRRGSRIKTDLSFLPVDPAYWSSTANKEWPKLFDRVTIKSGALHLIGVRSFLLAKFSGVVNREVDRRPDLLTMLADDVNVLPLETREANRNLGLPEGQVEVRAPFFWKYTERGS